MKTESSFSRPSLKSRVVRKSEFFNLLYLCWHWFNDFSKPWKKLNIFNDLFKFRYFTACFRRFPAFTHEIYVAKASAKRDFFRGRLSVSNVKQTTATAFLLWRRKQTFIICLLSTSNNLLSFNFMLCVFSNNMKKRTAQKSEKTRRIAQVDSAVWDAAERLEANEAKTERNNSIKHEFMLRTKELLLKNYLFFNWIRFLLVLLLQKVVRCGITWSLHSRGRFCVSGTFMQFHWYVKQRPSAIDLKAHTQEAENRSPSTMNKTKNSSWPFDTRAIYNFHLKENKLHRFLISTRLLVEGAWAWEKRRDNGMEA